MKSIYKKMGISKKGSKPGDLIKAAQKKHKMVGMIGGVKSSNSSPRGASMGILSGANTTQRSMGRGSEIAKFAAKGAVKGLLKKKPMAKKKSKAMKKSSKMCKKHAMKHKMGVC